MVLEAPYSYSYPTHKTGTAQDLMSVLTRSYEGYLARARISLPTKNESLRVLVEPPFILFGLAFSAFLEMLPAEWVLDGHARLFEALASPHRYRFDAADPKLEASRRLAEKVAAESGQAPALLSLISHPPVLGDMAHLNFCLVRHACLALREVRGQACRPRLLVATDLFALDTIPLYQEGIYAGFMGGYHLGFDRLALSRNALSRRLLRKSSWDRTPQRLLSLLARGEEAGLVLAGGVPSTTRILYAVREWLGRQSRRSSLRARPAEVLKRLRKDEEFARFEKVAPLGPRLAKSAWRMAEAWAMSALAGVFTGLPEEESGADSGKITVGAQVVLSRCLTALGLSEAQCRGALDELPGELSRETPYRARFFRILAGRVLAAGRPVVFVPVAHRVSPRWGIETRDAWAWAGGTAREVRAYLPGGEAWRGSPDDFAALFGRENFA